MANQNLLAPWRATFILGRKEKGCIFCNRLKAKDSVKNLIVFRGERCFVILNKFPYNSGHLMIVPKRHCGQIEKLNNDESNELFKLTKSSTAIIKRLLRPSSLNLGMNLGRSSGAGVPGHLHMHIVPRWLGDTNFMPVIAATKVLSFPIQPIYRQFKKEFARL